MCRSFGQPATEIARSHSSKTKDRCPRTHAWPTIVVQSFEPDRQPGQLEYMGIGIATEIALEITRYQEIRVLRQHPRAESAARLGYRSAIRALWKH
jgi:TolB-like protein